MTTHSNLRLQERVCIITGSAQGIGLATAKRFAREGAIVVVCDINQSAVDAAVSQLGSGALGYGVDVSDRASIDRMVSDLISRFGRIDVLVNNAGITRDASLLKMTEEQFDSVIDVNLKGVFNCTQAVAAQMVQQGRGSIINTSSISGVYGNFGQTNYSASKSALLGMTKTWGRELGPKGVRVNAIIPGPVATEMLNALPESTIAQIKAANWMRRVGQPEELANAYLFLASDESSYVNGTSLEVSGGVTV